MQRLPRARRAAIVLFAGLAVASTAAPAQSVADWGIDPDVLTESGSDLLRRAPEGAIDDLFQAVHAASRNDDEARALCGLFESGADRSLAGLNAVAVRLGPASRERFATAVADALVGATQSPPQPYDAAAALQWLKAAGATAAILHDGFVRGLNASGNDADSRGARCQSLRWLLDTMQARPQHERAAMTRWLLDEGVARLAP